MWTTLFNGKFSSDHIKKVKRSIHFHFANVFYLSWILVFQHVTNISYWWDILHFVVLFLNSRLAVFQVFSSYYMWPVTLSQTVQLYRIFIMYDQTDAWCLSAGPLVLKSGLKDLSPKNHPENAWFSCNGDVFILGITQCHFLLRVCGKCVRDLVGQRDVICGHREEKRKRKAYASGQALGVYVCGSLFLHHLVLSLTSVAP
jgi:hypothetical protein